MLRNQRFALALALACFSPCAARAQSVASISELAGHLKTGDTVYVTGGGPTVKGRLIEISPSSLAMWVDGRRRDVSAADLSRVQREKPATKLGALIGLAAGAVGVPVTIIAVMQNNCDAVRGTIHACDDEPSSLMIATIFGAIGAGIGAGAGAGVGSLFHQRKTVFAKPGGGVSVKPIVDRSRRGLAVSIGF